MKISIIAAMDQKRGIGKDNKIPWRIKEDFVHTFGDAHIYNNHIVQVKEQLKRKPRQLPKIRLNPAIKDVDAFRFEDIELIGYDPHPPIKGEVALVGGFS